MYYRITQLLKIIELHKPKHLHALQYWELCLIVIKCNNAATTKIYMHKSISPFTTVFLRNLYKSIREKKKGTTYLKIIDIWTFQKLTALQRTEPVKTFNYEYETIEI